MNKTSFFNYLSSLDKIELGLERIKKVLNLLNNPHNGYRTIHIAGTNGKGTTSIILSGLLNKKFNKTGLYLSPDTGDFRERISINEKNISYIKLFEIAEKIKNLTEKNNIYLTAFEFITTIAFYYFYINKVDIAVIETGLGGRLDATNVIQPEFSIITTISKDHTQYLGKNLKNITKEKCGIIKPERPVIFGNITKTIKTYIQQQNYTNKKFFLNSDFKFVKNKFKIDNKILYLNLNRFNFNYLNNNFAVALFAAYLLKLNYNVEELNVLTDTIKFPGRFEESNFFNNLYFDSSHNLQAIKNLTNHLSKINKKIIIVYSSFSDKNYPDIIKNLLKVASSILIFQMNSKRGIQDKQMREIKNYYKNKPIIYLKNIKKTLMYLKKNNILNNSNCLIVFTGSFEVVKELKQNIAAAIMRVH